MKSKALVVLSTLVMALALMAQSTTQTNPAPGGNNTKTCGCCNHDQADGKVSCCGKDATACAKDASCCKDGKCCQGKDGKACPMMSKDQNGKMTCCAGGKCSMMSQNKGDKSCCGGKMCGLPQAGA
ncbi:MAG: hypothetical protein ABR902_00265 [Candidatus Korobacteraceae bacterium]|jgi:hypothetical protein